ncbi:single-stranded DNA-binding protein [Microbacterium sp. RU33B]|uniref:single-stranded DNA-binding protein n=1 Tax=Microbacterium sp. RU33B TaxID=1907390 RepID=UPI0009675C84|nr:single-stranded DNA-binding protein [Microbacterium sp. RU33B]SIT73473.1 single-strand DNA-binding protein [Microbacterium sp. RU33B]
MSDTITVIGNIAGDPEHRQTAAGIAVTTFRVASSQRRFDRATGQWVEAHTNWYSVSAFRSLAQHAFRSLRKGDRVVLTGKLRVRNWDNGTARGTAVEIDADAIGHDLLWGTTTFEKHTGPVRTQAAESWSAGETPAPAWNTAEGGPSPWEAPDGGQDDGGDDVADSDEAHRPLVLVGADTPY